MIKTFALFAATALAEITGCYLPWLWLRKGGSAWLLVPACLSLAVFAWLLTLHPAASGRVYAAYGCVYVVTALLWLRLVDGVPLASQISWAVRWPWWVWALLFPAGEQPPEGSNYSPKKQKAGCKPGFFTLMILRGMFSRCPWPC